MAIDYQENALVFSPKYRLARHILFWAVHILAFSFLFKTKEMSYWKTHGYSTLWIPAYILYGYPVMYWAIPKLLLKGNYFKFSIFLTAWAVMGYLLNYLYRTNVLFPVASYFGDKVGENPWAAASYLSMNVMAGFGSMIVLFKFWIRKQHDFLKAENEKISAELQLLKAQVHPHFLFNTLNNIYSFSLDQSPKTPQLILKLSSLLSYVLYDCKENQVPLDKEIEIMKNYIDLEHERYGSTLDVSINVEGDIHQKFVAPLLLLPLLENAFKHGTSEQLDNAWLSFDLSVHGNILNCKIVNSKNTQLPVNAKGIGIANVRKRLYYLYTAKHELKLSDEGNFFVASLMLVLDTEAEASKKYSEKSTFVLNEKT